MIRAAAILAFALAAMDGLAHTRSESVSSWVVNDNGLSGQVTLPARDVTRLPGPDWQSSTLAANAAARARQTIFAASRTGPCGSADTTPLPSARGFVRVGVVITCDGRPTELDYHLLFAETPGHRHLLRILGEPPIERLLTDDRRRVMLDEPVAPEASAFYRLGIAHIASGIDHLLFLLALLLVATSARQLVGIVTGFTIGHSMTLALTVTGLVAPHGVAVESAIAYTIALVAIEPASRHSPTHFAVVAGLVPAVLAAMVAAGGATDPALATTLVGIGLFGACYVALGSASATTTALFVLASLFGLIHGFGFAGFLLDAGLGAGAVWRPLIAFNLGVETGQLLFVAAVVLVRWLVAGRLSSTHRQRTRLAVSGLCAGTAVCWLAARTLAA